MNKFVRTKSVTGSKFSKIFFDQLYTGWIVVVHLFRFFSLVSDGATAVPNLEPRFVVNFVPVSGTIASPIMHRFGRCFRNLLQDQMYFATH